MPRSSYVLLAACMASACVTLFANVGQAQVTSGCGLPGAERWQSTRLSPLDSVVMNVRGRSVTICYSRPSARGRSIDSLVPAGRMWRTGANEPTTLTISGRLNIAGAELDPGRYVLMTVPGPSEWRIVFHTTPEVDPAKMFATLREVATGHGRVEQLEAAVEQFTIRPEFGDEDAVLLLEWGQWRVHVPIRGVP